MIYVKMSDNTWLIARLFDIFSVLVILQERISSAFMASLDRKSDAQPNETKVTSFRRRQFARIFIISIIWVLVDIIHGVAALPP